jgi:hypothetical protein
MGQPGYFAPPPPTAKPPRSGADLAISISALVLTVICGAGASVLGVFSLAFLDSCPPESCSAEGAATAVFTALIAAFVIGVIGLVITVVQLYRRKRGWPFAVGTLVLCGIACVVGMVGYIIAVGG